MHAVGDVILHGEPPLLVAFFEKVAAVACAPTEIELKDRITSRTQELHFRGEAPIVARPRSAVGIDDDGERSVDGIEFHTGR